MKNESGFLRLKLSDRCSFDAWTHIVIMERHASVVDGDEEHACMHAKHNSAPAAPAAALAKDLWLSLSRHGVGRRVVAVAVAGAGTSTSTSTDVGAGRSGAGSRGAGGLHFEAAGSWSRELRAVC